MSLKARYIAFEGLPGSGKTTKRKLLVEKLQGLYPNRPILGTREPGGSEISEAIRVLEQGTNFSEVMDPICEQYLLAAARSQSLRKIVKPILDQDGIVVSDYSVYTSIAFQGFGRQLTPEVVFKINEIAVDGLWPDLVIVLDTPIELALSRTFDHDGDKFESLDFEFFQRVKAGYTYLADCFPEKVRVIDGIGPVEVVFERVWKTYIEFEG